MVPGGGGVGGGDIHFPCLRTCYTHSHQYMCTNRRNISLQRYEEEERKVQPLERVIDGIMEDIGRYKGKIQEIRDEMDAMGDIVDDITGFDDVQKPASAMEKFQELQKQSEEPEPAPKPEPVPEPEPEPEYQDEEED